MPMSNKLMPGCCCGGGPPGSCFCPGATLPAQCLVTCGPGFELTGGGSPVVLPSPQILTWVTSPPSVITAINPSLNVAGYWGMAVVGSDTWYVFLEDGLSGGICFVWLNAFKIVSGALVGAFSGGGPTNTFGQSFSWFGPTTGSINKCSPLSLTRTLFGSGQTVVAH
jgi:hypothetical protein